MGDGIYTCIINVTTITQADPIVKYILVGGKCYMLLSYLHFQALNHKAKPSFTHVCALLARRKMT